MDENTAQQAPQEDEHPHDGRLRALLHRLVAEQGRMKAAKALGVDHKTVSRSLKSGRLTMLLRAALLTKALDEGLTALAAGTDAGGHAEEEEPADPADRIKELAGEVLEAREAVQALTGSAEQLHKEHGERLAEVERRLAAVEVPPPDTEGAAVIGAPRADAGPAPAPARPRPASSHAVTERPPPASAHVVTEQPWPGDERAYGAAWPLVEEWRAVHARHVPEGKGVNWLCDEERLRELEIALIGEHELALPPERYRWDGFTRRAQLRWRERTLRRVRAERRRAQLRRLLTLGLWRSSRPDVKRWHAFVERLAHRSK